MSLSNYTEENWLKTLRGGGNGTSYSAPAAIYTKLHTGDPGEDGTANAAGETTRKATTFAAPSNPAGTMASNADVQWTNVSTSETISHVSLWDASTAGNCIITGALSASKAVNAGDTFTIASGDLTLTLS